MNSDYRCQFLPFLRYRRAILTIARLTLFVRCAVYHQRAAFLTLHTHTHVHRLSILTHTHTHTCTGCHRTKSKQNFGPEVSHSPHTNTRCHGTKGKTPLAYMFKHQCHHDLMSGFSAVSPLVAAVPLSPHPHGLLFLCPQSPDPRGQYSWLPSQSHLRGLP